MHDGHRKRMRNKFVDSGSEVFHPHEIMEMILYASNSRKDTNELAHRLIDSFGSFSSVIDAPYEELLKVKGVGEASAFLIKLIPVAARIYLEDDLSNNRIINSTDDAYNYLFAKYIDKNGELPSALFLDNKCKVITWAAIGEGDVVSAEIKVRKLVELCIKYQCASVIICHNHPSGIAIPSKMDCLTTQQMVDALKLINVRVIDHIILANNDYVSMAESKEYAILFS